MFKFPECQLPDEHTTLQRLCTVLEDEHSVSQVDRQIILLDSLIAVSGENVKIQNLKLLSKVIRFLISREEMEPRYRLHLQKILDLLKVPPSMDKSFDEVSHKDDILELFNTLGYSILSTNNHMLQIQLLEIVNNLLLSKRAPDSGMVSERSCIRAVEISYLMECLTDFLAVADINLYHWIIHCALKLCSLSKLCCWTLLINNVIETLLVRLPAVINETHLDATDSTRDLLWTLMSCTDHAEDWVQIPPPSRDALKNLRYVLRQEALAHAHPGRNNDALNNYAALLLKIMHIFPTAEFVSSGLLEDVVYFATLTEATLPVQMLPYFKDKREHLKFKKLMLACLALSPINKASIEIFNRYKITECLVTMMSGAAACENIGNIKLRRPCERFKIPQFQNHKDLDNNAPEHIRLHTKSPPNTFPIEKYSYTSGSRMSSFHSKSSTRKSQISTSSRNNEYPWGPEHTIELFRCTIPVVCSLFDSLHKTFCEVGLIEKLVIFVNVHYIKTKNLPDSMTEAVIKTIHSICASKVDVILIHDTLRKADTVETLLKLCTLFMHTSLSFTLLSQSIIYHSLSVVTMLMENKSSLQTEHADNSLGLVIDLYKRFLNPLSNDSLIDNKLMIATGNFAWEALVWNSKNVLRFITCGSIFMHIDMIERSSFSIQTVYLSILVDLCQYQESIPYLVAWRGSGGRTLTAVLCSIWRAEEDRIKVPRDDSGCVSDIERPIMGETQHDMTEREKTKIVTAYDVFGSVRPKIYAIFQLIRRHRDVANLCEEHYKLGHDSLTIEDRITMQVIEAYLPLKIGEIWCEIRSKQGMVQPIDKYLTDTMAERHRDWALKIQRAQRKLLDEVEERTRLEEDTFYRQVFEGQLASTLQALREVKLIAETTDREIFLSSQQKLRQNIEASRPPMVGDLNVAYPSGCLVLSNMGAHRVFEHSCG